MNGLKLSIVTIAYNNFTELIETLESIDGQSVYPFDNILVLSSFSNLEKDKLVSKYSKPFRKFYWDVDKSLFNAMNKGIEYSKGEFIIFLNAGDIFSSSSSIKLIKNIISENKCYSFKTLQVYKDISIIRENEPKRGFFGFGREKNLPPHQGFIAPNSKEIFFNENLKVSADNDWMGRNMSKYGIHFSNDILANFKLGGQSTYPTLKIIYIKLRYERFVRFIIECIKYSYSLFVSKKFYFVTMAKLRGYRIIKK